MNYHCLLLAHAKIGAYQCQRDQCQVCIDYQAGITKPAYPMPAIAYDVAWLGWCVAILTKNASGLNRLYPDD